MTVGVGGCNSQAAISIGYTRDVTASRGSPIGFLDRGSPQRTGHGGGRGLGHRLVTNVSGEKEVIISRHGSFGALARGVNLLKLHLFTITYD